MILFTEILHQFFPKLRYAYQMGKEILKEKKNHFLLAKTSKLPLGKKNSSSNSPKFPNKS